MNFGFELDSGIHILICLCIFFQLLIQRHERTMAYASRRHDQAPTPTHRIQSWDFSNYEIPDIRNPNTNLVVKEARIHNDASVDISEDGSILVTLIPDPRHPSVVGVYGLKPKSEFGRCLATCSLEFNAISVSLSPTARHIIVGLSHGTTVR